MAQCMAMGQAAGTVAALALGSGGAVRSVGFGEVADTLRDAGAIISMDAVP